MIDMILKNNNTRKTVVANPVKIFLICCLFVLAANQVKSQLKSPYKIQLNEGWRFHEACSQNWQRATVPGCVHTDLMLNGIIDDVFFEDNAKNASGLKQKIGSMN